MSMPADLNQPIADSSESVSPHAANFRTVSVNSAVEMLERSNLVKVDPVKLRDFLDAYKGEMSVGCGKASGENRAEIATDIVLAQRE